jgi:hypothetical protein
MVILSYGRGAEEEVLIGAADDQGQPIRYPDQILGMGPIAANGPGQSRSTRVPETGSWSFLLGLHLKRGECPEQRL